MPSTLTSLMRHVRRLAAPPETDSDADLLGRFSRQRDETAFAALVSRHGAMVFGVCRRVLRDDHAAEDASQATFLVLARKAGSVGCPDTLAAWLHGVAYRVALKARTASRRLECRVSSQVLDLPDGRSDPLAEVSARDLLEILEGEVHQLPEAYRLPLVLCCLEGLSQEEAGQRLSCTPASIRGRLERGRKRLHARLARRGLTFSAALAIVEASRSSAAVLAGSTVRSALAFAVGHGRGVVSQNVIALAEGGLRAMFWSKMKMALIVLAAVGLSGVGATWLAIAHGRGETPASVPKSVAVAPKAPDPAPPAEEDRAKNTRYFIFPVQTDLQRELAPDGTDVFVLFDTAPALADGKIDLPKLDLKGLEKALLPHKKAANKLHFTLALAENLPDDRQKLLVYALTGFGYDIGFSKVKVYVSYDATDTNWKAKTNVFTRKQRQPKGDEKATENKLVKAYPVRTELSRHFTSDADCVVVIRSSLDKLEGSIPQPVRDAIIEAVGKLDKVQKKRIMFVTTHPKERSELELLLGALDKLAKDMKFKASSVTFR